jgi:hypothetical protein
MAVAFAVVGTMTASFAVDSLRVRKGYRQVLRVIVMMIWMYCAIALRHVFA